MEASRGKIKTPPTPSPDEWEDAVALWMLLSFNAAFHSMLVQKSIERFTFSYSPVQVHGTFRLYGGWWGNHKANLVTRDATCSRLVIFCKSVFIIAVILTV